MASDALRADAEAAFPNEDWDDERLAGLKALVKACMSSDYDSDEDDDELDEDLDDDGEKPGKADLAILFGKPKKK